MVCSSFTHRTSSTFPLLYRICNVSSCSLRLRMLLLIADTTFLLTFNKQDFFFQSKADDQNSWRVFQNERLARLREKLHHRKEQLLQGRSPFNLVSLVWILNGLTKFGGSELNNVGHKTWQYNQIQPPLANNRIRAYQ